MFWLVNVNPPPLPADAPTSLWMALVAVSWSGLLLISPRNYMIDRWQQDPLAGEISTPVSIIGPKKKNQQPHNPSPMIGVAANEQTATAWVI